MNEPIFKCDFKSGDRVVVDKGRPNSSEVTILYLTPQGMFATVRADDGYEWTTMTTRLSPIELNTQEP